MTLPLVNTDTTALPTDDVPWAELSEGIEIKYLRRGGASGTYTIITRFAPGTVLPRHQHFGEVHAYTMQGRWHYQEYDWWAEAGSYAYEPPGSTHTLEVPADATEPAVVMFVIQGGLVLLDDDDRPWWVEDAQGLYNHYVAALEGRGIPVPTGILP
ncbi:MAG TPA: 2,4'-dihydroxyacetophenone dioxygenase family protein [Acidimicrobiia bacterium]|nr:2,4'-dihydroxyacetophenone dioxygenase family protein [Acidimicrobiia bacterium]